MSLLLLFHPKATGIPVPPTPATAAATVVGDIGGWGWADAARRRRRLDEYEEEILEDVIAFLTLMERR